MRKLYIVFIVAVFGVFFCFKNNIFAEFLIWNDSFCDNYLGESENERIIYTLINRSKKVNTQRQYQIMSECYSALKNIYKNQKLIDLKCKDSMLLERSFSCYRVINFAGLSDADKASLAEHKALLAKIVIK